MMDLNFWLGKQAFANASLRLPNTNCSNNKDNDGGVRAIFLASLCYCIFLKKTWLYLNKAYFHCGFNTWTLSYLPNNLLHTHLSISQSLHLNSHVTSAAQNSVFLQPSSIYLNNFMFDTLSLI